MDFPITLFRRQHAVYKSSPSIAAAKRPNLTMYVLMHSHYLWPCCWPSYLDRLRMPIHHDLGEVAPNTGVSRLYHIVSCDGSMAHHETCQISIASRLLALSSWTGINGAAMGLLSILFSPHSHHHRSHRRDLKESLSTPTPYLHRRNQLQRLVSCSFHPRSYVLVSDTHLLSRPIAFIMSVTSQRSLRSTSSCSTFSDATTLVDEEHTSTASIKTTPFHESVLSLPSYERSRAVSTFGKSSGVDTPAKSPLPSTSRAPPSSPFIDQESGSSLVQLLCRLLPSSKLAKKIKNAPREGEEIYKAMSSVPPQDKEKLEWEKERLLAVDKRIAEEFGRLGW